MTVGELTGLMYRTSLRIEEYNSTQHFLRSYELDFTEFGDIPFDLCAREVEGIEAYEDTIVIDITEV